MASIVYVDNIENLSGNVVVANGYPTQPGQILEWLMRPCDGGNLVGLSGTYTVQDVTTQQVTTTSYEDITGSTITYTPPAGTTSVTYSFTFSAYWGAAHAINHFKFFIDADEVVYARHDRSGTYPEMRCAFEWTIPIGGSADPNTGRQATWTTAKTLKMQSRRYGASNWSNYHGTTYWDGTSGNQFNVPLISIQARC
jgi:hypothetical protein